LEEKTLTSQDFSLKFLLRPWPSATILSVFTADFFLAAPSAILKMEIFVLSHLVLTPIRSGPDGAIIDTNYNTPYQFYANSDQIL
jgi:hypothetical protein